MNIYTREMFSNKKSFIIWVLVLLALNTMMFAFFPSVAGQVEEMERLLEMYPESFRAIFGLDRLSMADIMGWYGVEIYLFVTLLGSIYAMMLAVSILSKEESEKTAEFLLAKPVTRTHILTAKALAVLTYVVALNLILFITNLIFFEIFKTGDYSMGAFYAISLGPLMMHLTFAALGYFISVFIVRARAVYPIAIGAVLGMYFVSIMSALHEKIEFLKYFTPFQYVDAADLIINERIQGVYIVIMLGVITLSVALTYLFYSRKDITM